jgi:phosphoserine phosphatase RsbU/P
VNDKGLFDLQIILDSLNDGIYTTDRDRRIMYWSRSAERITGWTANEIEGRACYENLLCHIDKDCHQLCGNEYCPLHRAIITGQSSDLPIIVFANAKDGRRIPMQVSVAPIRNSSGEVVGGVEIFRDLSEYINDLERARKIQFASMTHNLPQDDRIRITAYNVPRDIIGGDFYSIEKLDSHRYAFLLADVTGHGIAAALYTMHLKSLWDRGRNLMAKPVQFMENINRQLCSLLGDNLTFATGMYGLIDLETNQARFVSAGNPYPLLFQDDNTCTSLNCSGFPLGMMEDSSYDEIITPFQKGSSLLLYTDGVFEIFNTDRQILGEEGLLSILREQGYPKSNAPFKTIEEQLLVYSNNIRLEDDLTFLEFRFL